VPFVSGRAFGGEHVPVKWKSRGNWRVIRDEVLCNGFPNSRSPTQGAGDGQGAVCNAIHTIRERQEPPS